MKFQWILAVAAAAAVSLGAAEKQAILLTAFGTTHEDAARSYDHIEQTVQKQNKGIPVYRAYTSNKVRAILKKRGTAILSVPEALAKMKQDGVEDVTVFSLHVVPGLEYNKKILDLVNEFQKGKNAFRKIEVSKPMVNDAGELGAFCDAVLSIIPADRQKGDAVVLMGHNNEKETTDALYAAMGKALRARDPNVFVGTVEGSPAFETVLEQVKKNGARKAYLIPLLVVAGDHAKNDLAGEEEDSWKSVLEKNGVTCVPVLKGLGEYDAFARLYASRLQEALKR
jgi:sirohydrochlorin cobaltochelatase